MTEPEFKELLDAAYSAMDGSEVIEDYFRRHGIESRCILTIFDDERADLVAWYLSERVAGKTVVEIGGGLGLLAFCLADFAERVYVIEASPVWTSIYVQFLHARKPKNVTFIFGSAEEVAGQIRGDIALFCTHSDCEGMRQVASQFAPEVIDVYGEILSQSEDGVGSGMVHASLRAQVIPAFRRRCGTSTRTTRSCLRIRTRFVWRKVMQIGSRRLHPAGGRAGSGPLCPAGVLLLGWREQDHVGS